MANIFQKAIIKYKDFIRFFINSNDVHSWNDTGLDYIYSPNYFNPNVTSTTTSTSTTSTTTSTTSTTTTSTTTTTTTPGFGSTTTTNNIEVDETTSWIGADPKKDKINNLYNINNLDLLGKTRKYYYKSNKTGQVYGAGNYYNNNNIQPWGSSIKNQSCIKLNDSHVNFKYTTVINHQPSSFTQQFIPNIIVIDQSLLKYGNQVPYRNRNKCNPQQRINIRNIYNSTMWATLKDIQIKQGILEGFINDISFVSLIQFINNVNQDNLNNKNYGFFNDTKFNHISLLSNGNKINGTFRLDKISSNLDSSSIYSYNGPFFNIQNVFPSNQYSGVSKQSQQKNCFAHVNNPQNSYQSQFYSDGYNFYQIDKDNFITINKYNNLVIIYIGNQIFSFNNINNDIQQYYYLQDFLGKKILKRGKIQPDKQTLLNVFNRQTSLSTLLSYLRDYIKYLSNQITQQQFSSTQVYSNYYDENDTSNFIKLIYLINWITCSPKIISLRSQFYITSSDAKKQKYLKINWSYNYSQNDISRPTYQVSFQQPFNPYPITRKITSNIYFDEKQLVLNMKNNQNGDQVVDQQNILSESLGYINFSDQVYKQSLVPQIGQQQNYSFDSDLLTAHIKNQTNYKNSGSSVSVGFRINQINSAINQNLKSDAVYVDIFKSDKFIIQDSQSVLTYELANIINEDSGKVILNIDTGFRQYIDTESWKNSISGNKDYNGLLLKGNIDHLKNQLPQAFDSLKIFQITRDGISKYDNSDDSLFLSPYYTHLQQNAIDAIYTAIDYYKQAKNAKTQDYNNIELLYQYASAALLSVQHCSVSSRRSAISVGLNVQVQQDLRNNLDDANEKSKIAADHFRILQDLLKILYSLYIMSQSGNQQQLNIINTAQDKALQALQASGVLLNIQVDKLINNQQTTTTTTTTTQSVSLLNEKVFTSQPNIYYDFSIFNTTSTQPRVIYGPISTHKYFKNALSFYQKYHPEEMGGDYSKDVIKNTLITNANQSVDVSRDVYTLISLDEILLVNHKLKINNNIIKNKSNIFDLGNIKPIRILNVSFVNNNYSQYKIKNGDYSQIQDSGIFQGYYQQQNLLNLRADFYYDKNDFRSCSKYIGGYKFNFNYDLVDKNSIKKIVNDNNLVINRKLNKQNNENNIYGTSYFIGNSINSSKIKIDSKQLNDNEFIYITGIFSKKEYYRLQSQIHTGVYKKITDTLDISKNYYYPQAANQEYPSAGRTQSQAGDQCQVSCITQNFIYRLVPYFEDIFQQQWRLSQIQKDAQYSYKRLLKTCQQDIPVLKQGDNDKYQPLFFAGDSQGIKLFSVNSYGQFNSKILIDKANLSSEGVIHPWYDFYLYQLFNILEYDYIGSVNNETSTTSTTTTTETSTTSYPDQLTYTYNNKDKDILDISIPNHQNFVLQDYLLLKDQILLCNDYEKGDRRYKLLARKKQLTKKITKGMVFDISSYNNKIKDIDKIAYIRIFAKHLMSVKGFSQNQTYINNISGTLDMINLGYDIPKKNITDYNYNNTFNNFQFYKDQYKKISQEQNVNSLSTDGVLSQKKDDICIFDSQFSFLLDLQSSGNTVQQLITNYCFIKSDSVKTNINYPLTTTHAPTTSPLTTTTDPLVPVVSFPVQSDFSNIDNIILTAQNFQESDDIWYQINNGIGDYKISYNHIFKNMQYTQVYTYDDFVFSSSKSQISFQHQQDFKLLILYYIPQGTGDVLAAKYKILGSGQQFQIKGVAGIKVKVILPDYLLTPQSLGFNKKFSIKTQDYINNALGSFIDGVSETFIMVSDPLTVSTNTTYLYPQTLQYPISTTLVQNIYQGFYDITCQFNNPVGQFAVRNYSLVKNNIILPKIKNINGFNYDSRIYLQTFGLSRTVSILNNEINTTTTTQNVNSSSDQQVPSENSNFYNNSNQAGLYPVLPVQYMQNLAVSFYEPIKKISLDINDSDEEGILAITQPSSGNIAIHYINKNRANDQSDRNHGADNNQIKKISVNLLKNDQEIFVRSDHNYDQKKTAVYHNGLIVNATTGANIIYNYSNGERQDLVSYDNSFNIENIDLLVNKFSNKELGLSVSKLQNIYITNIKVKNNFQKTNNIENENNGYINRMNIQVYPGINLDITPDNTIENKIINYQCSPLCISQVYINDIKSDFININVGVVKINILSKLVKGPLPKDSSAQNNPDVKIQQITIIKQQFVEKYCLKDSNPSVYFDTVGKYYIFYEYNGNISCAVSNDKGYNWFIYYDLLPLVCGQRASNPYIIKRQVSGVFNLFFLLNNIFLCSYQIDSLLFNINDSFIKGSITEIQPKKLKNIPYSLYQPDFSDEGNKIRLGTINIILGGINNGIDGRELIQKFKNQQNKTGKQYYNVNRVNFNQDYISENITFLNYNVSYDAYGRIILIYNLGDGFTHVKIGNIDGVYKKCLYYTNILGNLKKYYNTIGNSHDIYQNLINNDIQETRNKFNQPFGMLLNKDNNNLYLIKEYDMSQSQILLYGVRSFSVDNLETVNQSSFDKDIDLKNTNNQQQFMLRNVISIPIWMRYSQISNYKDNNFQYNNLYFNQEQFDGFSTYNGCGFITSLGALKYYYVNNNKYLTSVVINGDSQILYE